MYQGSNQNKYRSIRKIPLKYATTINNISLEQREQQLQRLYKDCRQINDWDISPQHNQQLKLQNLWIHHQYFYPNSDRMYFASKQMEDIVKKVYDSNPKNYTFKDIKLIQKVLPKPRIFNTNFIMSQRNKLHQSRTLRDQFMGSNKFHKNKISSNLYKIKAGTNVLALHPQCQHFHLGQVYANYQNNAYLVAFNNNLGTFKIPQTLIATIQTQQQQIPLALKKLTSNLEQITQKYPSISIKNRIKTTNIKYLNKIALCKFTQLLELKCEFVVKIQEYNDYFESKIYEKSFPSQNQLQQYGWIGSVIGLLDVCLKYLLYNYQIIQYSKNTQKTTYLRPNQQFIGAISSDQQLKNNQQLNRFQEQVISIINKYESQSIQYKQDMEKVINIIKQVNLKDKNKGLEQIKSLLQSKYNKLYIQIQRVFKKQ